jgi:acyl-CoA thioester hydrolase
MNAEPLLNQRDSYTVFCSETLRFSDTDMIGHVNNVAYAALLESGRTLYTRRASFPRFASNQLLVLARIEIDYRRELHWPNTVDIGTRLSRIGTASFVLGQGIFLGDACITTGRSTLVMIDRNTRRSVPLSPAYRQALMQDITNPQAPAIPVP